MWNWLKKHVFKRRKVGDNASRKVGDNTIGEVGANASFYKSCTDGVILYNKQQERLFQSGHKTKPHILDESKVCGTDEFTPMYMNYKMAPTINYTGMDEVPYERSMKYISSKYHAAFEKEIKNKGGRSRRKRRTRARRTRRYSKNLF